MRKTSRSFQVFVKPIGSICNLKCHYCYYLDKKKLYKATQSFQMPDILLEEYIVQHIEASSDDIIRFSWHGGEPTLLGLDFFKRIVKIQNKYKPRNQKIANGLQTNGTLLNDKWGEFFAKEDFFVGLSLDGPQKLHDRYRLNPKGESTFDLTMQGYELLQKHGVNTDILCVVNNTNVKFPLKVYDFFKEIGASYISFLPLVVRDSILKGGVNPFSVRPKEFGEFLCTIFDQWVKNDIGKIKIQIFEEATRTAFGLDHALCIFRKSCGDIPVVEYNGDLYSCDHFVDQDHLIGNILERPLVELLESEQQRSFGRNKLEVLPKYCMTCSEIDMCNGGCPRDRFIVTPDVQWGLNYLCVGYKKFFTHYRPFVDAVSKEWRKQGYL